MKIEFTPLPNPGDGQIVENRAYALSLGLPAVVPIAGIRRPPLAVVGGGPSIAKHVDTLRNWQGGVWAINGAVQWCLENGIRHPTLFTIEREPREEFYHRYAKGVRRAVLATICRPVLFDLLLANGAEIHAFEMAPHGPFKSGSTSVSAVPHVAFTMGHESVTLFGCESSWLADQHAYADEDNPAQMLVQCGPGKYLTSPQLLWQARELAPLLRGLPGFLTERSGGLLRAMAAHENEYDIIAVSPEMQRRLVVA